MERRQGHHPGRRRQKRQDQGVQASPTGLSGLTCCASTNSACWTPPAAPGNFLYLALKALRDLEKRVRVEARDLGLQDPQVLLQTGPHNILGLEINDYAAELARVTVWIGDIQWCRRNGYPHATDPILQALDGIEHRDALC
jgi:hypothetical protein